MFPSDFLKDCLVGWKWQELKCFVHLGWLQTLPLQTHWSCLLVVMGHCGTSAGCELPGHRGNPSNLSPYFYWKWMLFRLPTSPQPNMPEILHGRFFWIPRFLITFKIRSHQERKPFLALPSMFFRSFQLPGSTSLKNNASNPLCSTQSHHRFIHDQTMSETWK